MKAMNALIIRNLRLFFRDRSAVFFSLLAVFIIIGMYVLFLGDVMTQGMTQIPGARFLMDSWIMAGLLAVTSATTTLGAFGIMVEDRSSGKDRDFNASPVPREAIAGAYLISTFLIGLVTSLITLALCEAYILLKGGSLLPLGALWKVLGLILLTTLASSAMVAFLVSFFRSNNAFSSFSTVVGTLIGFLTGIYIPMGNLPESVQLVIKSFPIAHGAALFRQVFMEVPLAASFAGAPEAAVRDFETLLGIRFQQGSAFLSPQVHLLILVGSALLFFLLAAWRFRRRRRS